ncbi:hypothetical protein MycrhDRAFT_3199 [Mycolicibacterium rhodesiae JS60]|nr:hypothetical protein MycrhDRAFT_3199 [Mycolicibacterium rhodesiae JS60]
MHIAVRSTVATGVALVGASAIALSPIQPVGSSLSNFDGPMVFSVSDVQLTATFDPVTPWVEVLTAAVANVTTIGQDWLADPLPALRQMGTNWFGYAETTATALGGAAEGAYTYFTTTVPESLTTAFQQIADGDLSGAAGTINNALGSAIFTIGLPLFPVLDIPGKMAENFTAVVKTVTGLDTLVPLLLGVLGPLEGGIQSFGDSAQAVLDAIQEGDTVAALNAAFAIAPNVLGAVLNGYQDNAYPGLLTAEAGGLVYSLVVTVPRAIATALGATAPTGAAKVAKPAASAEAAEAKSGTAGSARTTGLRATGKKATKADRAAAGAKKSTGAKTSTGAKSARPHRGGNAA